MVLVGKRIQIIAAVHVYKSFMSWFSWNEAKTTHRS